MAAALAMGSAALVFSLVPSSITRFLALLLGGAAGALAYTARRNAIREGRAATMANAALGLGAAAVVLSGLIFVSCHACSGKGELDQAMDEEFQQECGRAFEEARRAHRAKLGEK